MRKSRTSKKQKNKFNKYFLLTWKKFLLIVASWFLAVFLHNAIYGMFQAWFESRGGDEAVFFTIATIIIPAYFIISVFYTLFIKLRNKS